MNLVKVVSSSLDKLDRRLVKLLRLGLDDVQECLEAGPYGMNSSPIKDAIAVYAPTLERGKAVVIGYINKNQYPISVGEMRSYSTDDQGEEQFYFYMKNDGTAELGGADDYLTRYNALETGFNQLVDDHNVLVDKWNAFVMAYVPGGPSVVGSPPTLAGSNLPQSNADISDAKIEEIRTL